MGRIPIAGVDKPVDLDAPIGTTLIVPGAAEPNPIAIDFKTPNNLAVELEIMIHVIELGGLDPRVYTHLRWQIWALGHGDVTVDFPPPANQNLIAVTKQRIPRWCVPARGVAVRVAGRNLRLYLSNEQPNTNPIVQVSLQPVLGASAGWRPYPAADASLVFTNGDRSYFPCHATEWKISPIQDAVGAGGIDNSTNASGLLNPQQSIALWRWSNDRTPQLEQMIPARVAFDWLTIPPGAHSWTLGRNLFDPVGNQIQGVLYR